MNMKPNLIAAFMLMTILTFSTYASAEIIKCVGKDGQVTYVPKPKESCIQLNLEPAKRLVPVPAKLTKKQQKQIDSDVKEVLKLNQESHQAQMGSFVECKGEKNCKKAFALTQVYISQKSDMKLQIVTDTVIETYNSTKRDQLAIKATKTPEKGDVEKINLIVSCKEQYTDNLCLLRKIDVYKQFRPYIEASLR